MEANKTEPEDLPLFIARKSLNAMFLEAPHNVASAHRQIVENAFDYLISKHWQAGVSANGKEMHSWPYCYECKQPFSFDKDEPFAYCMCPGTTEWGYPRPASWVPNPTKTRNLSCIAIVMGILVGGTLGILGTVAGFYML